MNILVIGDKNSIHIKRLIYKLYNNGLSVNVLGYNDTSDYYNIENECISNMNKGPCIYRDLGYIFHSISNFKPLRVLGYIFQAIRVGKIIKNNNADILNFQALLGNAAFVVLFNKIHVPIIASFWGTEIWESQSNITRFLQNIVIKRAAAITVINDPMRQKVLDTFPDIDKTKIYLVRYGILDFSLLTSVSDKGKVAFKQSFLGISVDSKIIVVSYSAAQRHNHETILKSIEKLSNYFEKENVYIIVPMTYGDSAYRDNIKDLIKELKISDRVKIIDKYMSDKEIAILRNITDVFINLPTQDSFSATMLEHLYCNNIVITGGWLPYDDLFDSNAFFIKLPELKPDLICDAIISAIENMQEMKKKTDVNKEVVEKIISKGSFEHVFEDVYRKWKEKTGR